MPEITVGQIWRRKNDGRRITVTKVRNVALPHEKPYRDVHWKGADKPGRGALYEDSLCKRYELEVDNV